MKNKLLLILVMLVLLVPIALADRLRNELYELTTIRLNFETNVTGNTAFLAPVQGTTPENAPEYITNFNTVHQHSGNAYMFPKANDFYTQFETGDVESNSLRTGPNASMFICVNASDIGGEGIMASTSIGNAGDWVWNTVTTGGSTLVRFQTRPSGVSQNDIDVGQTYFDNTHFECFFAIINVTSSTTTTYVARNNSEYLQTTSVGTPMPDTYSASDMGVGANFQGSNAFKAGINCFIRWNTSLTTTETKLIFDLWDTGICLGAEVNTNPTQPNIFNTTNKHYNANITINITPSTDADDDTLDYYWYRNTSTDSFPNLVQSGNGGALTMYTTNETFDGGYWYFVNVSDGTINITGDLWNWTLDTTVPTLLTFNLTNNTRFGFGVNATMNITMQDTNPFLLVYTLHNLSVNIENASSNTLVSSTTISITKTLNLSALASGNYTLDINFSDRSTIFSIKNYDVNPISDGINFRTKEDNDISIIQTFGLFTEIKTKKLVDRYTFSFGKTEKREQRKYLVIADKTIHIPKYQDHKGHLIVSEGIGGNWISFDNNDLGSEVSIMRIGGNIVEVTVYSNDFNFQSIGGLNVVNVFYTFQVDNDVPDILSSINNTAPFVNDIVNISANATDIIAISTLIIGHNDSGAWVNVSNSTILGNITNTINLHYLLTVTASQGSTIGVMACANDTFNQFSCGSVQTMQVNDTTIPAIKGANNATRFLIGQNINFTYNATDNFLLSTGQVILTNNSVKSYFNFSLSGTSNEFSQIIVLSGNANQVINVTGRVNDSFNNFIQTEIIFRVTKDFFVNASNIYDNISIKTFTVTLFNSTSSETKTAENNLVNFTDIVTGLYNINISSDDEGGYFNRTFTNYDVADNLEAQLHQAIVYFTAVRRGTDVAILDYNLSLPLAVNQSNSTGGLRFLLNASKYQVSGESGDYFDNLINISLANQSVSRLVSEFYDINVSIAIFSVVNNTWLYNFTITLEGTSFTETQVDVTGIDEGNLTFSLGNGTYDITVMHDDFATSFFSFDLISNSTYPNISFSLLGLNSINFSVFDEVTELLLEENATIELISDSFVGNFTADDGILYVQDIIPGEYRITYDAITYTKRDYYVSILNDTNQTIELYLLSTTNGTEVTFTVQDNSGQDLENATIRLKRYYLSSNSYRTVAMSRTNTEGKAIIDVDFNDAFYETLTTFKDLTLRTIGAKMIATTLILTMNPITDPFTNVDAIDDIQTSMNFNNLTETFTYTFTDLNGNRREGTLTVIEITPTTETVVCTSTDTSASATLICQVNTTNKTGTFSAKGEIKVGSTSIVTDALRIVTGLTSQLKDVWGGQGVFFTILVAGTIGGLGMIVSPAVGIIMFLASLMIVNFFGMTIMSTTIYGFFILVGIFIIWKMKR